MKKGRNILVVALMLLTVMSMYSVSGTYAKYTTTETITDAARAAKWDIAFSANDEPITDTLPIFGEDQLLYPGAEGQIKLSIKNKSEVAAVLDKMTLTENQYGNKNYTDITDPLKFADYNIPLKYCISDHEDYCNKPSKYNALSIAQAHVYVGDNNDDSFLSWNQMIDYVKNSNTMLSDSDDEHDITLYINWKWVFESNETQNKIDTLIGLRSADKFDDFNTAMTGKTKREEFVRALTSTGMPGVGLNIEVTVSQRKVTGA